MPRLRIPGAAAAALLATALAAPAAFAQPAAPSPAPIPDAPAARGPATRAAEAGQQAQAQEGRRSSRIIGSIVYNDRDERIGTVDDLMVGQDGRISGAVLSVGGFLGLGAKLVAVPYDQLRFEPRTADRTTDDPAPAARAGTPAVPDPGPEERWRTDPRAEERWRINPLCCMGRRCGRTEPDPCSGSGNADVLRASEVEHSVQHVGGDGHLGRLPAVRPEA